MNVTPSKRYKLKQGSSCYIWDLHNEEKTKLKLSFNWLLMCKTTSCRCKNQILNTHNKRISASRALFDSNCSRLKLHWVEQAHPANRFQTLDCWCHSARGWRCRRRRSVEVVTWGHSEASRHVPQGSEKRMTQTAAHAWQHMTASGSAPGENEIETYRLIWQ